MNVEYYGPDEVAARVRATKRDPVLFAQNLLLRKQVQTLKQIIDMHESRLRTLQKGWLAVCASLLMGCMYLAFKLVFR